LVQPDVGAYLNRHYVPAFQKVATFQKIGNAKVGGNVAGYFCTPDGLVLHLVAGPVNGRVLLNEARWANETYEMARLENQTTPAQLRAFFRRAHVARLHNEHGAWHVRAEQFPEIAEPTAVAIDTSLSRYERWNTSGKVHLMLASAPLPPIEQVYQPVFERLLNERISTNPVAAR
jgi:hypothetical protein